MMSGWVLDDQALVSLNGLEDMGLFDRPLADICPFLGGLRIFFLCVGRFPARLPIVGELLEEICFDVGRL